MVCVFELYNKNVFNWDSLLSDIIFFPHDQSDDTAQFLSELDECINKQKDILNDLPITIEIAKRNHHIELLASVHGKYDYFEVNSDGKLCNRELGLDEKPDRTMQKTISECDM